MYILILLYHFLLSKYVKEFWFWVINSKNHSTLHLNQMSSVRVYNFCNYNFTVLPIFTIEEENKESQFSWCAESWEHIKCFVGPLVVRSFGIQSIPALPMAGPQILTLVHLSKMSKWRQVTAGLPYVIAGHPKGGCSFCEKGRSKELVVGQTLFALRHVDPRAHLQSS